MKDDEGLNWQHERPIFAKPDDGYAYTKLELTAIWELPVDLMEVATARTPMFQFHEHVMSLGMNIDHVADIDDHKAADMLLNDSVSQFNNRLPDGYHDGCSLDCTQPHLDIYGGR